MAITNRHRRDNPWWQSKNKIFADPHLTRMNNQIFKFHHGIPFNLNQDIIYTLRGPRQVGKTTYLKILIKHLLFSEKYEPENILYLDIQGAGCANYDTLREMVEEYINYIRIASNNKKRIYIFLDEVTSINDWGAALRIMYERGLLENTTILATGPHALDIQKGGESMPGRRGKEKNLDWIMSPLSFGDYVKTASALAEKKLPEPFLQYSLFDEKIYSKSQKLENYSVVLSEFLEKYILTGGFPYAIEAELQQGHIPKYIYNQHRDAILQEIRRSGHRETYYREIVDWLANKHLGDEFSWTSISKNTHIGSKNTARNYLEDAELAYVWHILYRVIKLGNSQPAPGSPKKIYPIDPFTWHTLHCWSAGIQNPWEETITRVSNLSFKGKLMESVIADHLYRKFGSFTYFYRDKKGREKIDFVLHKNKTDYRLLEMKYRETINSKDKKLLLKYGGGILCTKKELDIIKGENVIMIPAYNLLAGTTQNLTLFPKPL